MATSVRRKIRLGTLFLFLLLLLCGGVGTYYVMRLKNDAKLILQDNHESLAYCHTMQRLLDSIHLNRTVYLPRFEAALKQQESNISEPREGRLTSSIRHEFNKLRAGDTANTITNTIKQRLQAIISVNMAAIEAKNKRAETTADNALTYISLIGTLIFLVAFTFSYNFPFIITDPIRELTEAIKQIGSKNYRYRIHISNKDEFGQLADAFNAMAERLEYFESSNLSVILFEKRRAEAVINSLKDASIGIDKTEFVLFANNQALELLGVQAQDIVGKTVSEVSHHNDLFTFLLEEKNTIPFKIVVNDKENYFTKETIEVSQDGSSSKVIVLKNITSFKELDAAKTNFIATVSHELKTPLASSDFSLKLLEDDRIGNLSIEQKELVETLKRDNLRMLKILSELLNMSQVETGRIQLNVESINPAQIIANAIQTVLGNAKEKEITITDTSDKNLPLIDVDLDKTTWVLNNFLTNAIKYSFNNGSIEIFAIQQNGNVVFSVEDHGPGINKEYLPRLFERYFQVPGSKEKGTGLGLAISKEFIEAQGGKIWVESEIGKGTVFNFQFPLHHVPTRH